MGNFNIELHENLARLMYNNYILVLHAGLAGEGVALGWHHVVSDLVARGELVRPLSVEFSSGSDFYVVARKGRKLTASATTLRDWLIAP